MEHTLTILIIAFFVITSLGLSSKNERTARWFAYFAMLYPAVFILGNIVLFVWLFLLGGINHK